jgi:hypothetical protein
MPNVRREQRVLRGLTGESSPTAELERVLRKPECALEAAQRIADLPGKGRHLLRERERLATARRLDRGEMRESQDVVERLFVVAAASHRDGLLGHREPRFHRFSEEADEGLDREKARIEPRYAELIYDGLWFSPLKESFDAFVDKSQEFVTGEVRLRLSPDSCTVTGRRSEHSLYDYELATYDAGDSFRHEDSAGFVRLWGLGIETWAARQGAEPEER